MAKNHFSLSVLNLEWYMVVSSETFSLMGPWEKSWTKGEKSFLSIFTQLWQLRSLLWIYRNNGVTLKNVRKIKPSLRIAGTKNSLAKHNFGRKLFYTHILRITISSHRCHLFISGPAFPEKMIKKGFFFQENTFKPFLIRQNIISWL